MPYFSRVSQNLDLYIYKHSIKMTDIGLTARLGDTSTRFEIWFRKRKPHDIFTLQAATQEVKQAWTEDISQLLWKQALKNRGTPGFVLTLRHGPDFFMFYLPH